MSIAIPPTRQTVTVEVSRFPKPPGNILAKPTQELQHAENNYIEHLRQRVAEETSEILDGDPAKNNANREYELATAYLSLGIFNYVNPLVQSLADKFLNSSNARVIYEIFQPIVNTELATGASPKDAAIEAIKKGVQKLKSVNSPALGNTLQEIDTIVGDNSPFSLFTTLLKPLTERRDQDIKDTEAPFINSVLTSLVNRVVKLSIKPEFQETPTAKEASKPESVWSWSDEYN